MLLECSPATSRDVTPAIFHSGMAAWYSNDYLSIVLIEFTLHAMNHRMEYRALCAPNMRKFFVCNLI